MTRPSEGVQSAITGYMRVRGDFWGVGGAVVRHQRVLCHREFFFVFQNSESSQRHHPTPPPFHQHPSHRPHDSLPKTSDPSVVQNNVSALSDLPSDQSVVPTHTTTPRVVFRPPTAILRAGRTPANRRPGTIDRFQRITSPSSHIPSVPIHDNDRRCIVTFIADPPQPSSDNPQSGALAIGFWNWWDAKLDQ